MNTSSPTTASAMALSGDGFVTVSDLRSIGPLLDMRLQVVTGPLPHLEREARGEMDARAGAHSVGHHKT